MEIREAIILGKLSEHFNDPSAMEAYPEKTLIELFFRCLNLKRSFYVKNN